MFEEINTTNGNLIIHLNKIIAISDIVERSHPGEPNFYFKLFTSRDCYFEVCDDFLSENEFKEYHKNFKEKWRYAEENYKD